MEESEIRAKEMTREELEAELRELRKELAGIELRKKLAKVEKVEPQQFASPAEKQVEQAEAPAESRALVPAPTARQIAMMSSMQEMRNMAEIALSSGTLPKTLKTPEQIITIMLKGREVGLTPMAALEGIYVVSGRAALDGKTMLAIAYQSKELKDIKIEDEDKKCTVTIQRKGFSPYTYSFSMDDARKANLLGSDAWKKYPREMLRWRAVSGTLRVTFPDFMASFYAREELEGTVPFGTLPVGRDVIEAEVVSEDLEAADIKDWLDLSFAAKRLGFTTEEAYYELGGGKVVDVPTLIETYKTPQAAYERLIELKGEKGTLDKKRVLFTMIANSMGIEPDELPQGLQDHLNSWLDENPDIPPEEFPVMTLVDPETGDFKTWEGEQESHSD